MTDMVARMVDRVRREVGDRTQRLCFAAVRRGLSPSRFGYRYVVSETPEQHVARMQGANVAPAGIATIFPPRRARNSLPVNVTDRHLLPSDVGWWGYSMRDVPERQSEHTYIATIPDARIVTFVDDQNEFWPAILSRDETAINLREIVFREGHAATLRRQRKEGITPQHLAKATWILERVYDNHSHWLTAHLPKLCLLQARDQLGDVILPQRLKPSMETSLRMMGLDPARFRPFDPARALAIDELTILGTDRFRPEMLRPVRDAIMPAPRAPAERRIYISRSKARFRILENEEEIWPLFRAHGFERIWMEDLTFPEQVKLMSETKVLAGPHGAGLTNMMFCPEGAHVIEIAWLGFPNPNFYAIAAAMGHDYSLVPATAFGDVRPLEQDLRVDPRAVREALANLSNAAPALRHTG
jgi:hypothetical protein